jgi:hypothetical protein
MCWRTHTQSYRHLKQDKFHLTNGSQTTWGEVDDCIKVLSENIEVVWGRVKSEDKAGDIASRTDAVPGELVEGTEWQGSCGLPEVARIRMADQDKYHGRHEGAH